MFKKTINFLCIALLAITITSCAGMQAKHQMSRLESLVEKVEQKGENYTSADWDKAIAQYDEITAKMAQCEYTNEQLQEIGALKARFYAARVKNAGNRFKDVIQQVKGAYEQVVEEMDEGLDELESMFE